MHLPEDFQFKMKQLLREEYEDFLKAYQGPKQSGLRINTLKISVDQFLQQSPFELRSVPWTDAGFYYDTESKPGKHPFHDAGLYYIQEPSAMAVAEIVDPQPGEKVLDLCAAPGGKTTHLAALMNQEGLLVSNEIHPARAKVLSQNVERMGIKNAVVLNETPDRLATRFQSYFDRILVDAPCSGEGMFRKDPKACEEWSLDHVAMCARRQTDILEQAAKMLRPGGRLVYSTCTFSPEENEQVIQTFLQHHASFSVEKVKRYDGFDGGRPDWLDEPGGEIEQTIRIWPQRVQGEGHYIAVLSKSVDEDEGAARIKRKYERGITDLGSLQDFRKFADEQLVGWEPNWLKDKHGKFLMFSDQLYLFPDEMLSLEKLKVMRPGWHLGSLKKNRFEPSHALALSIRAEEARHTWNLDVGSDELHAYLHGEALKAEGPKGWYLVLVDGHSLGWAKLAGGLLKNHYPKGLRW